MNRSGIDLASKTSAVCIEDETGRVVTEFEMPTDEDGFRTRLGDLEPMHCVVEVSPLAEWAAQMLESLGHAATPPRARPSAGIPIGPPGGRLRSPSRATLAGP